MNRLIIDISRSLTPSTAVWPGDQAFEHRWTSRIDQGSAVNVSAVVMSTHAGTHADAPLHYADGADPIDRIPLSTFVGEALVVEAYDTDFITPEHVASVDLGRTPRVLFKTRSSDVADDAWQPDITAFAPETIERLRDAGVVLVGTDAPSVDPVDSADLPAHRALARSGIVNLENLALRDVAPGRYHLAAVPLKMPGLDAAPVRAVLWPFDA